VLRILWRHNLNNVMDWSPFCNQILCKWGLLLCRHKSQIQPIFSGAKGGQKWPIDGGPPAVALRHWCHRRVHSKDGLLFCNSCGREIQSQGQGHASEILSDDHFVCDKCNKQFPDIESLYQHKAKDHGTSNQCDVCKELEAREATGIGYICCVCDAEFEIATELEDHMSMHDNVLSH
jgi:hypothetical protein